jgi:hypothetical protein
VLVDLFDSDLLPGDDLAEEKISSAFLSHVESTTRLSPLIHSGIDRRASNLAERPRILIHAPRSAWHRCRG